MTETNIRYMIQLQQKKNHFITGYVHVGILHEVKIFRKKIDIHHTLRTIIKCL